MDSEIRRCGNRSWIRTIDHLAANNRTPEIGQLQWNVDIVLDTGRELRIHVGEESRRLILDMLKFDAAKAVTPKHLEAEDGQ